MTSVWRVPQKLQASHIGVIAVLLSVAFSSSAFAEFLTRRDATVSAIETKFRIVTVLVASKARTTKAQPEKHRLSVGDDIVFRQISSRRKTQASFADLKIGQHVILSGISGIDVCPATEIVILPGDAK